MKEITYPLSGTTVTFQGVSYTLQEDPHCTKRYPDSPLEPTASATSEDGTDVEIYWFLFDEEQPISDDAIHCILTIEED